MGVTSSGDESDARPCGDGESAARDSAGIEVPGEAGAEKATVPARVARSLPAEKGSWRVASELADSRVGGMCTSGRIWRTRADG